MPYFMQFNWYFHSDFLIPLFQNPSLSKKSVCELSDVTISMSKDDFASLTENEEYNNIQSAHVVIDDLLGGEINEAINKDNIEI